MTISEEKINEILRSTPPPQYTVSVCNIAPPPAPSPELAPVIVSVNGTCYGAPVFTETTREYLLRLRREIEESGTPLKSAIELEREIDELKGR
jgi:hypothetical protein